MDSKELRGLMEAYAEMYAPQEVDEATAMTKRGYDEAPIRQNIAKSTGGGEAADRATALASRPSFGNDRAAQQRERLARTQRGDFRNTTSSSPGLRVGQFKSNDPKVQAKQAARGAQRGALTPAEKQQLNREEFDIFDIVLEFLQVEGYAETLEEAEWLMSNVIDEEAIGIILGEEQLDELSNRTVSNALNARISATGAASDRAYKNRNPEAMRAAETAASKEAGMRSAVAKRRARMNKEEYMDEAIYSEKGKAKAAEMIAKRSTPSGRAKPGKGANVAQIRQIRGSGRGRFDREGLGGTPMTPTMAKNPIKKQNYDGTGNKAARRAGTYKEAFEAWLDEAMTNYEKNRKRAAQRAAARNEARKQGKTGAVPGVGYVTPRPERETWTDESGKTRHAKGL